MNEELLKQAIKQFLNSMADDNENESNQDEQKQHTEQVLGEMCFDMFGNQSLSVVLTENGFSTKFPENEEAMLALIAWVFDMIKNHDLLSDKGMLKLLSMLNDTSSDLANEISSYLEEE